MKKKRRESSYQIYQKSRNPTQRFLPYRDGPYIKYIYLYFKYFQAIRNNSVQGIMQVEKMEMLVCYVLLAAGITQAGNIKLCRESCSCLFFVSLVTY